MNLHLGDCLDILRTLPDNSVDSVVTDPPYGLSFMGKKWDYDVPTSEVWAECLRVLKPGGHLLAFAGTRTQHRMAVRIEDAGFEIRDMIAWVYGSGFPKSLDVSKAIDKAAPRAGMFDGFAKHYADRRVAAGLTHKAICAAGGFHAEHNHGGASTNWEKGNNVPTLAQWNVLQPLLGLSCEWLPLIERIESEREVIGQKSGTMLTFAPGQDNDCSATTLDITAPATGAARQWQGWGTALKPALEPITVARKPFSGTVAANVLAHGTGAINVDGCRVGDTVETWPKSRSYAPGQMQPGHSGDTQSTGEAPAGRWPANLIHDGGEFLGEQARFFYCAKASKRDRDEGLEGFELSTLNMSGGRTQNTSKGDGTAEREIKPRANTHPTVKPTDLMRYLCRLVTPPGGTVLDPFMGSGSTGKAAKLEGFQFIGIEREAEYLEIARARIAAAAPANDNDPQPQPHADLFSGIA